MDVCGCMCVGSWFRCITPESPFTIREEARKKCVHACTANKKGCIWLPQFDTSSASLNTVETHCLLYIPNSD